MGSRKIKGERDRVAARDADDRPAQRAEDPARNRSRDCYCEGEARDAERD